MEKTSALENLETLSRALEYSFRDPGLLLQAFCHSSYVNEQQGKSLPDNERLEFLGDAVLDLAISHLLMDLFHKANEGDLSRYRAMLVDEPALCLMARRLGLGHCAFLGKGEEQTGGREKPSILANLMEALMGALYLDAGFEKTREVVSRLFGPEIEKVGNEETVQDFKTLLQELTQERFKDLPKYALAHEMGPAHDKTFEVLLTLNEREISKGMGKSKKEAEQDAARKAYLWLKEN